MAFKSLYEAKTVKIHVLGQAPEGDLKRPFKGAGGMFGGTCSPHRYISHVVSSHISFCGTTDRQGCDRRGRKTHWRQEGGVRRHAAEQGTRLAIIYFLLSIYSSFLVTPCVICIPGRDSNWRRTRHFLYIMVRANGVGRVLWDPHQAETFTFAAFSPSGGWPKVSPTRNSAGTAPSA